MRGTSLELANCELVASQGVSHWESDIRGQPLIIWGAWSGLKKKLFGASLKKIDHRVAKKKKKKKKIDQRKSKKKTPIAKIQTTPPPPQMIVGRLPNLATRVIVVPLDGSHAQSDE